ncbi:MAG: hypothetical protein KKF30_03505 [Proteobacteria bacterium]|nr:hypothetical protein [Pseudomonadota bacterium]MBU4470124.1 hypothetical protein [Pseudomonadota bacterium]
MTEYAFKLDGGATENDVWMQIHADILACP